ncbi:MAG TPA: ribonuclease D [Gammaproteobacteria bacterium]|nr:ribonuclease D [Gammaproteobacteria bacterium]
MKEIFVDTPEALATLCDSLRGCEALALDSEFLREKTYYTQLCLLQIASDELIACVDPLALETIDPLLDIFYDPQVVLVMHSARQDLEIFFDLRGSLPGPVFDTQVAATLLGYGDQIGYANLVREFTGVELDKQHTRTDWSCRPLGEGQLRYAADDVRYLLDIYREQRRRLQEKGREEWLQADFDALVDTSTYDPPVENLWKRVRGNQPLKGRQLAIAQALAVWREEQARRVNRPRRWVLKDDVIIDIARRVPKDLAALEQIRGLEGRTLERHGEMLLGLVEQACKLPQEAWPQRPKLARLTPQQDAVVDLMMAIVRTRGAEHDVSTALLGNRKALEALMAGAEDSPLRQGWRALLVGRDLQALLAGECGLRVADGRLVIEAW